MKSIVVIGLVLGIATGCTTTSKTKKRMLKTSDVYKKSAVVESISGGTVVQQLSRSKWIQVREETKDEYLKIYGAMGAKEWNIAINESKNLLRKKPKNRVALTNLATAYAMKRNYEKAAYYGNLLEKYHGSHADTLNLLGLSTLNSPHKSFGDYYKAANYFRRAFDSDDKQVASGLNLGFLYLDLSKNEKAIEAFSEVAERCNNCSQALVGKGIALSRSGKMASAERTFKTVLRSNKKDVRALYYLALISHFGDKDNKKASKLLVKVLRDPSKDNYEIKRRANFLLRKIQAQAYSKKNQTTVTELSENTTNEFAHGGE